MDRIPDSGSDDMSSILIGCTSVNGQMSKNQIFDHFYFCKLACFWRVA